MLNLNQPIKTIDKKNDEKESDYQKKCWCEDACVPAADPKESVEQDAEGWNVSDFWLP